MAQRYFDTNKNAQNSFIFGAEWADRTMIEKACNWLLDNTMSELNLDFGNSLLVKEFVDHFKESMEI